MAAVSRNAKTALILASIALASFLGLILKYWAIGG
ncbi:MAG: cytochrome oxidase small assembly protein [Burkholderiales bacterium]